MNTIGEYVSQKEEIVRLNKQIDMVAGFYIKQIESIELKLSRSQRLLRHFRSLAYTFKKPTRTDRVIDMLTVGGIDDESIAKSCHVCVKTVKTIKRKLKNAK